MGFVLESADTEPARTHQAYNNISTPSGRHPVDKRDLDIGLPFYSLQPREPPYTNLSSLR